MRVLADDMRGEIDGILGKYPNSRSAALPLLFLVQSVQGYVSEEGMKDVADILGLTSAQVLATASFYTMLKKRPQGEYLISVCRNISCTHLGSRRVLATLEDRLGVSAGETTDDGRFSLESAECLATCDGAPSLQINYEDFYRVTPKDAIDLVDRLEGGDSITSVRGETVRTAKEIAREIALAGMRIAEAGVEEARTIGGESPRADTAPGFRPKVKGEGQDG
ncbi:MAG: NADH-quinone oxidoreductase subunit [Actinomycetota bacterium]|nr:NADH-quinone oxidoreductase subunit [Actinomycetota bacterium]